MHTQLWWSGLLVQAQAHQTIQTPAEEPKPTQLQLGFQSGGEVGRLHSWMFAQGLLSMPCCCSLAKAAEILEEGKPAHDPGAGVNEAVLLSSW